MQAFLQAKRIWPACDRQPNQYADFRQRFSCRLADGAVTLRIAADSDYCVRMNGEYVFAGQYADFEDMRFFDEIDVTEYLKNGENEIDVAGYCTLTDSSTYRAGTPGVRFEALQNGDVLFASGGDTLCALNARYRAGEVARITGQLGYTFDYDATRPENAFAAPEILPDEAPYAPRPVKRPVRLPRKRGEIVAQGVYKESAGDFTVGQRMQYAYLAYRETKHVRAVLPEEAGVMLCADDASADGVFAVIDLGEEDAGFLDVEIGVDAPCETLIGWGEHLDDMRPRTWVGTRNFASRYVARAGRQRFTHCLRRLGLRYVSIYIRAKEAKLYYAGITPTVYPVRTENAFSTCDALHGLVYDVCKRTLVACMHEHYEDCPWREQALYTMDSRNQMLAGYYALGEYEFPKASMRLLAHSLREDGMLELCAPAKIPITIPSFSAMFVVQLQEYFLFTADAAFAGEMLPAARAICDAFMAHIDETGMIPAYRDRKYWNFYEWQPYLEGYMPTPVDGDGTRYDMPLQCFVALALSRLSLLMTEMGDADGAARYSAAFEALSKAADARMYDAEKGIYMSFANRAGARFGEDELTQSLALYARVCPEEKRAALREKLIGGALTPVTISHTIFKYDALLADPARYSRWVFSDVADKWGYMLRRDATTFWETIRGGWDFDRAGSLCHGWSAVPAYLYFAYALGLRPTRPGFAAYDIHRVNSGLYELRGLFVAKDGKRIEL